MRFPDYPPDYPDDDEQDPNRGPANCAVWLVVVAIVGAAIALLIWLADLVWSFLPSWGEWL
ncbi:hypothetical protein [Rhizobium sp. RU36D]|uniref:hypothetical protein n=1 Tax=Rhizobium sp. RU36D TaxID=1907415 RepID=UPI0009D7C149|nr:hypothetical protein [Rhizobium sp. RU36D]SMD18607.1 hypothetical protein SAMN05880593_13547 [Rhizobium sp. RU36D]